MNTAKKYTFFALNLLLLNSYGASDFDNADPVISDKFSRGSIAIYDCKERSLVCAKSTQLCQSLNITGEPCKVLKSFKENRDCEEFVLEVVSQNYAGDFCSKK